ncbi:hypothetical protein QE363_000728 [Sphingomonas sp. SORGH_AS870]|uniref:hypothetical protein n=1 Tax=Sphingomonas sp. SORGH_AS_0870 TaxID=3041801 RepID=UPI00286415BB|nr:hypothetical protein [Sphingomonas sp. SORGH_AS_0870]MDR6144935.1 hypothetical protein [Sphingomonas sp. SORGH_AS_0870]
MERVSRDHLRLALRIGLGLYKRTDKQRLGIHDDLVLNKMVEDILTRVMGTPFNEAVILRPSRVIVQAGELEGRWGRDEPHPDEVLPPGTITKIV